MRTKKIYGWLILGAAATMTVGALAARDPKGTASPAGKAALTAAKAERTPLQEAEERVSREPDSVSAHHRLAVALMQAQRETGDEALYLRAEQALAAAKRLEPEDYQTRKLLAWVVAGQHRFDEALTLARECVRQNPSDYWNYGVIGDALTETGDYEGALTAVQKMVDLRPGSLSYSRAAEQRRLHGDPEGSLELYTLALEATGPREAESRAWIHTQMGDIQFQRGNLKAAEDAYAAALKGQPAYYLAMAGQAQLRAAQGKLSEAAAILEGLKRFQRPHWMATLGDLYQAMGQRDKAEAEYQAVEKYLGDRLKDPTADAGHQLAQFLADRGRSPERALALAQEEAANAKDIAACDTLAWALYHAKQYDGAWTAAQKARRLGTRDPKLLYHAGMIALQLPARRSEGAALLRKAVALNPAWHPLDAPLAKQALQSLSSTGAEQRAE